LNDHLAGATAGSRLAGRVVQNVADDELRGIDIEIGRDRATLQQLMNVLDVPQSRVKQAAGALGEIGSRVKLRLGSSGHNDLQHLLALESLAVGIAGKRRLWVSLRAVAGSDPRLHSEQLDQLISRADQQLATVEDVRVRVARRCLTANP
jgi:hypothetical protein